MLEEKFPEILLLSHDEMAQIVEELQVILESDSDDLELTPEQLKELDRRWQAHLADPSSSLTLEEFKESFNIIQ